MADNDRTQEPSDLRQRRARQEGQVAKSHELVSAAVFTAGFALLFFYGTSITRFLTNVFHRQFTEAASLGRNSSQVASTASEILSLTVRQCGPLLGWLVVASIASHLFQAGFQLHPQRILPDPERINPARAFLKVFSWESVLIKGTNAIKAALVVSLAIWWLVHEQANFSTLTYADEPLVFAGSLASLSLGLGLRLGLLLCLLGLVDYALQYWLFREKLKMTPDDQKEEARLRAINPVITQQQRDRRRELDQQRYLLFLQDAYLVVKSPLGYLIVLKEFLGELAIGYRAFGIQSQYLESACLQNSIPLVVDRDLGIDLMHCGESGKPIAQSLATRCRHAANCLRGKMDT